MRCGFQLTCRGVGIAECICFIRQHGTSLAQNDAIKRNLKGKKAVQPAHARNPAVVWFAYLLVYGALPLWISGNIYALLTDAVAPKPAFWLLLALVPAACVLPSFLLRSIGMRAPALVVLNRTKQSRSQMLMGQV